MIVSARSRVTFVLARDATLDVRGRAGIRHLDTSTIQDPTARCSAGSIRHVRLFFVVVEERTRFRWLIRFFGM
jgi:hypothetical protein